MVQRIYVGELNGASIYKGNPDYIRAGEYWLDEETMSLKTREDLGEISVFKKEESVLDDPIKYTVTFEFNGGTQDSAEYEAGETIVYPENTEGYKWPDDKATLMPAEDITVTEEAVPSNEQEGE